MDHRIARPAPADLAAAVNASAGHVSGLTATLLPTCAYLVITMMGVDHETLLRASGIRLPLLSIRLPLLGFFTVAPAMVLILHVNLLLQSEILRQKLAVLRRNRDGLWATWSALVAPSPAAQRFSTSGGALLRALSTSAFAVTVHLPFLVLLAMEYVFLPYQSGWATFWLAACATVDLMALIFFLSVLPCWERYAELTAHRDRPTVTWRNVADCLPGWRQRSGAMLALVSLLLPISLTFVDQLQRLELRGATLVAAEPDPELVAALLAGADAGSAETLQRREEIRRRFSQGLDLSGRSLRNADLTGAKLYNARLSGADLSNACLRGIDLTGANLNAQGLEGWSGLRFPPGQERWDRYEDLEGDDFSPTPTRLVGADLTGATLAGASLLLANLDGATLDEANLRGVHLLGASLRGAKALRRKVYLAAADLFAARLDNARLPNAEMTAAMLRRAHLTGADLSGAYLQAVDLRQVHLSLTKFAGADLRAADFAGHQAALGTDFRLADLRRARNLGAQGAVLREAKVAAACLCPPCDPADAQGPGTPQSPPTLSRGDFRSMDVTPGFKLPLGWPSLPPAVEGLAWVDEAHRRVEASRDLEPCRPVPGPGSATPGAAEGAVTQAYTSLSEELVQKVCDENDIELAHAIVDIVDRDDPLRRALSRGLMEAVASHGFKRRDYCRVFRQLPDDVLQRLAIAMERR